ncbi:MAG: helix-turn-helix domain-containing protein [Candidatus Cybelea sp.]
MEYKDKAARDTLDEHVDWSRLTSTPQEEADAIAAESKRVHGLTGRYTRFRTRVDGEVRDIPIPDVKALREGMGLTQAAFASRFRLSQRTVQQWEQGRALPDTPARILLKAIERAPEILEAAAAEVDQETRVIRERAR